MRKRVLIGGLIVLGVLIAALAGNTARNAARWQPLTETPTERAALLAPGWRLVKPEGPGPFKAAVLMSGCDGVHDNMDLWAGEMVRLGRAALIVDSHGPRGLDQLQAWRAVCAGQVLTGAERAGDIAVAIKALSSLPEIDPHEIALIGASHGGWSVMELLDLLGSDAPPPGLSDWPEPRAVLSARIGPAVMLYPYCGLLSGAAEARWPAQVRGLMLLSQNDSIVDPQKCRTMSEGLIALGDEVEVVTLAGADHGFDQNDRSFLSTLKFDQGLVDQAKALIVPFILEYGSR
ncbi:dienelactone hydrolase family protein [Paracoccus aminophilus]|uniref:Dienelactone hydrolase n=1 Tax=Paracoccus aminophilus JCM 7686 TaxID=1367847 RepID=S5Z142_PARAH|nr:dienelactone hydrolase [Paracoccus aminophilus]AGT11146.1 dienelactone hydrolase [Paracoccus aminophilus JCM 7686]